MGSLITEIPQSEVNATLELFDRLGISRDDLKWFRKSQSHIKAEVARLMKGRGIRPIIIDCDADPFTPKGWAVVEHQHGGQLAFEPTKIELYIDDGQKSGQYIDGHKLRLRLGDTPVLNANVLDFLLANPNLIPEEWKTDELGNARFIFFWGTIYHDGSNARVRYLNWNGANWNSGSDILNTAWGGNVPAAVLAD